MYIFAMYKCVYMHTALRHMCVYLSIFMVWIGLPCTVLFNFVFCKKRLFCPDPAVSLFLLIPQLMLPKLLLCHG